MRPKSLGSRSSGVSSFLSRLELRLGVLLMGRALTFALNGAPNDGGLDHNDRTIVERVNQGNDAVYIERTFSYNSESEKKPLMTPQTHSGIDIS